MKINDIITEAGILDKLVGTVKKDYRQKTQARNVNVNQQYLQQASIVATREWRKKQQQLLQSNNYQELTAAQQEQQLTKFVDENLLGSYRLDNTSAQVQQAIRKEIKTIIEQPSQTQQSMYDILQKSSKLALDPQNKPSPTAPGQAYPATIAGELDKNAGTAPFNVKNNVATTGSITLNLSDSNQRLIYDRIRQEVAKGNIKA